jgi:hypothetical protein
MRVLRFLRTRVCVRTYLSHSQLTRRRSKLPHTTLVLYGRIAPEIRVASVPGKIPYFPSSIVRTSHDCNSSDVSIHSPRHRPHHGFVRDLALLGTPDAITGSPRALLPINTCGPTRDGMRRTARTPTRSLKPLAVGTSVSAGDCRQRHSGQRGGCRISARKAFRCSSLDRTYGRAHNKQTRVCGAAAWTLPQAPRSR